MTREKSSQQPTCGEHCDHCGGAALQRDASALRCACGSLLARYVDGGIELKCRRCKRTLIVLADVQHPEASTG